MGITNHFPPCFALLLLQYTHAFHDGKYASQASHDNPYSEGHGHGHDEHH